MLSCGSRRMPGPQQRAVRNLHIRHEAFVSLQSKVDERPFQNKPARPAFIFMAVTAFNRSRNQALCRVSIAILAYVMLSLSQVMRCGNNHQTL